MCVLYVEVCVCVCESFAFCVFVRFSHMVQGECLTLRRQFVSSWQGGQKPPTSITPMPSWELSHCSEECFKKDNDGMQSCKFVYVCMSVCLAVCLYVCMSVCLPVFLSYCLSVCRYGRYSCMLCQ